MFFNMIIDNEIVFIIFDDGKVNVVGFGFIDVFNQVFDSVEVDVKVVVIYGGEGKFCGGFDFLVMKGEDKGQ